MSLALAGPQATGRGTDTLTSIENLLGSDGNDRLTGNGLDNVLAGGLGSDTLRGGAGADLFRYDGASDIGLGTERIADFATGEDHIDLRALGLTGVVAAFSGVAGELRISGAIGFLLEGDLNGDQMADFRLQVIGSSSLAASDILLS